VHLARSTATKVVTRNFRSIISSGGRFVPSFDFSHTSNYYHLPVDGNDHFPSYFIKGYGSENMMRH